MGRAGAPSVWAVLSPPPCDICVASTHGFLRAGEVPAAPAGHAVCWEGCRVLVSCRSASLSASLGLLFLPSRTLQGEGFRAEPLLS